MTIRPSRYAYRVLIQMIIAAAVVAGIWIYLDNRITTGSGALRQDTPGSGLMVPSGDW